MTQGPIQLLAVIPDEWRKSLTDALTATDDVDIWNAPDWQSARAILNAYPQIDVVLCASVLFDTTWQEVLADVSRLQRPPQVLIVARYADPSLWYDVLEGGAYDLIVYPFSPAALLETLLAASAGCREQPRRGAETTKADGSSDHSYQENA